jgi:hypothetical protein
MYNMIAEIARAIRTAKSELARVVPDVLSPDALDGVRIFASGPPGAVAVSLMM